MQFQDRSVIVTGAAGGIGCASGCSSGARLTLTDRGTVRGDETMSAVRPAGGTAQFISGDVASAPFVEDLVELQ